MSPASRTSTPLTELAVGKDTTNPPGQWASVPGFLVYSPTRRPCWHRRARPTRSVPAAERDGHGRRHAAKIGRGAHQRLERRIRDETLERIRMLVGNGQHARTAFQDIPELRSVHQTLDGEVNDDRHRRQRCEQPRMRLERHAGAGRPNWHGQGFAPASPPGDGTALPPRRSKASSASRTFSKRDWDLGQDGDRHARLVTSDSARTSSRTRRSIDVRSDPQA